MSLRKTESSQSRHAVLYRMVMDQHLCPYGLKSRDLLKRAGYTVDDRALRSREAVEAFKAEHAVKTTPQVFINGQRIGFGWAGAGSEDVDAGPGGAPEEAGPNAAAAGARRRRSWHPAPNTNGGGSRVD